MASIRKIIHIDMDAFYASVEQRDNPELKGRPVAVGQADGRGVVAAASYEARRYGVRSAMSSSKARKLCPDLVFVDCRFDVYKQVSAQIHEIFHEYTDIIEPISLDEAFLDVTVNHKGIEMAVDIAKEIKKKIRENLGLVASAGISYNKFLAKIASDYRKPDGLCIIHPDVAVEFIAKMPVESFWGVGPVTASKMHAMGIYTGNDLRNYSVPELRLYFGKAALQYYNFARGIDERQVEPFRVRKSLGCERTFDTDIYEDSQIQSYLALLTEELLERIGRKDFNGNSLTLKVKFNDFSTITRTTSEFSSSFNQTEIYQKALELWEKSGFKGKPVRLLGLTVNAASKKTKDNSAQLTLDFEDEH